MCARRSTSLQARDDAMQPIGGPTSMCEEEPAGLVVKWQDAEKSESDVRVWFGEAGYQVEGADFEANDVECQEVLVQALVASAEIVILTGGVVVVQTGDLDSDDGEVLLEVGNWCCLWGYIGTGTAVRVVAFPWWSWPRSRCSCLEGSFKLTRPSQKVI